MNTVFLGSKKISILRKLSLSYAKDLCDYNNNLIKYRKDVYHSGDQDSMYTRLKLNYYILTLETSERLLKQLKNQFISQFLIEFKDFHYSIQTLTTVRDFEYEKYKLEILRENIACFYLSNKDVGGLSRECLNLLDNMVLYLLTRIAHEESECRKESNDFNNILNVKYEIENSSLDKKEVRIFSLEEMVEEFEINEYW